MGQALLACAHGLASLWQVYCNAMSWDFCRRFWCRNRFPTSHNGPFRLVQYHALYPKPNLRRLTPSTSTSTAPPQLRPLFRKLYAHSALTCSRQHDFVLHDAPRNCVNFTRSIQKAWTHFGGHVWDDPWTTKTAPISLFGSYRRCREWCAPWRLLLRWLLVSHSPSKSNKIPTHTSSLISLLPTTSCPCTVCPKKDSSFSLVFSL